MTAASRRILIICLDTALLIIFLLLLSPRMTGLALHEALGIIFFMLLIIHLLISWAWILKSVKKFFKVARRAQINFILNGILFILAITAIASGFFISQVALPAFGIKTINDRAWRLAHNLPLNFTVLFVALHIAINWKWIASVFRKRLKMTRQANRMVPVKIMTIVLRTSVLLCAMGIVALALYMIIGDPSLKRLNNQNEIARFTPTLGAGVRQFVGETLIIALYAFVARKWLRVKL